MTLPKPLQLLHAPIAELNEMQEELLLNKVRNTCLKIISTNLFPQQ